MTLPMPVPCSKSDPSLLPIERSVSLGFAACALLSGGAVVVGATIATYAPSVHAIVAIAGANVLLASGIGLVVSKAVASIPRLVLSSLMNGVGKRLALQTSGDMDRSRSRRLAWLNDGSASGAISRRVCSLNQEEQGLKDSFENAVRQGRVQTRRLASELYQETEMLINTYFGLEENDARLREETRVVAELCESQGCHLSQLTSSVLELSGIVNSLVADIGSLSQVTGELAAQSAQARDCVVALDREIPEILSIVQMVRGEMTPVVEGCRRTPKQKPAIFNERACDGEGQQAPCAVGPAETLDSIQRRVQRAASQVAAWLDVAKAQLGGLKRMVDVQAGLEMALARQGEALAGIAWRVQGAQAGFGQMRQHVREISRHSATLAVSADALKDTAARLPRHADGVAALLRDVPDFYHPEIVSL